MIMIFVGIIPSWIVTETIYSSVVSFRNISDHIGIKSNNIHYKKTIISSRTSYNYSAYIVIKSS